MSTQLTVDKELDYRVMVKESIGRLEEVKQLINDDVITLKVDDADIQQLVRLALPYAEEGVGFWQYRIIGVNKTFWVVSYLPEKGMLAFSDDEELYVIEPEEQAVVASLGTTVMFAVMLISLWLHPNYQTQDMLQVFGFWLLINIPCAYLIWRATKYEKWGDGKCGLTSLKVAQALAQRIETCRNKIKREIEECEGKMSRVEDYKRLITQTTV